MAKRLLIPVAFMTAALLLVGGFAMRAGVSSAQDMMATPNAMSAHPAHIHTGTCDALGEVVFPLTDVSHGDMMATPEIGAMDATPANDMATELSNLVETSETTVAASLDTIISGGHAINVHESAENIQNYIACGEVTGTPESGELEIQLDELNDSGYTGRAVLTDNADGTTTVVIMLVESDGMSTPVASPVS